MNAKKKSEEEARRRKIRLFRVGPRGTFLCWGDEDQLGTSGMHQSPARPLHLFQSASPQLNVRIYSAYLT